MVRISANAGQLPPEHQQKGSQHAIVKPAEESSFFAPIGIPNGNFYLDVSPLGGRKVHRECIG